MLGVLANLEHVFVRSAVGQVRDLVARFRSRPWDLIIGDAMSLGTPLAAEVLGVHFAGLSVIPLVRPSVDLPPPGLGLHPGVGRIGVARDAVLRKAFPLLTRRLQGALAEVRLTLGLDPDDSLIDTAWYSPWLLIATGTPALEYPRSDMPDQFHFVGRLAPATRDDRLPKWWAEVADPERPVVLITQGTLNIDPLRLIRPASKRSLKRT